jgi:hypothetical protein
MPTAVHRTLKIIAFNANSIGNKAYEVRKQLQDLKTDVALFSRDISETTYKVLHSKLCFLLN